MKADAFQMPDQSLASHQNQTFSPGGNAGRAARGERPAFSQRRRRQSYFLGGPTMPERIVPGPVSGLKDNCEAVCIHTKKIYDSCRDKDIAYLM